MNRSLQSMTASSILLLAAAAAPALAQEGCKPVVGSFEAVLVAPGEGHCPAIPNAFCTAGRVWGAVQGTYQFVMTGAASSGDFGGVPAILFFAGQSTVFLKSGQQITGTDTGSIDLTPGRGGFASLITFDAGGGASGQIRLRGDFDAGQAATSGDYIGSLCVL